MARRKKRQQQVTRVDGHDIPVSTRRGMDVKKLRHEEKARIGSPKLSHDDICKLADNILKEQGND